MQLKYNKVRVLLTGYCYCLVCNISRYRCLKVSFSFSITDNGDPRTCLARPEPLFLLFFMSVTCLESFTIILSGLASVNIFTIFTTHLIYYIFPPNFFRRRKGDTWMNNLSTSHRNQRQNTHTHTVNNQHS